MLYYLLVLICFNRRLGKGFKSTLLDFFYYFCCFHAPNAFIRQKSQISHFFSFLFLLNNFNATEVHTKNIEMKWENRHETACWALVVYRDRVLFTTFFCTTLKAKFNPRLYCGVCFNKVIYFVVNSSISSNRLWEQ